MSATPSDFPYALDRLVISGRRLFGWGWAAHPAQAVKSIHLHAYADGGESRIAAGIGLARPDVEQAFPALVGGASSGFVVTGYVARTPVARMVLDVELADGSRVELDVSKSAERLAGSEHKRRQFGWMLRSVWRRVKRGDLRGIVRRARAQNFGAPTVDDLSIVHQIAPLLRRAGPTCLMFDHNMGGGANQYRRGMIAERLARGEAVLLCTYNLPLLEYRLHLHRPGEEEQVFGTSSFVVLEALLDEAPIREIFVNSPVSFDEPLVLADWLARMREEHPDVRLVVTAHDYFSVCPSFVLLNAEGRYCGIPDLAECARCLSRHEASYVSLSPPSEIGPWRSLWGRCLEAADEVRCFSDSTRDHLLRAYPALGPRGNITVIPHRVDFVPQRRPHADRTAPLVIGVVGEISYQKGAAVVEELVKLAERDPEGPRVVVIGTLDLATRSRRLTVTGRYRREELPALIEANGVNMLFFTSIWPETFSYVVAEMMELGLPIVAFDVGAPAERLANYPLARLCPEISAASAFETLVAFHRQLARPEASAA